MRHAVLRRVTAPFAPVPFPPELEKAYYPQVQDVVDAVRATVGEMPFLDGPSCVATTTIAGEQG